MTWQAIPWRAAALVDQPMEEVQRVLRRVDVWQRAARAVGYRIRAEAGRHEWQAGMSPRVSRIGERLRPRPRHGIELDIDDAGLPAFTVRRGPAAGGRLTLTLSQTGAGVLLTAQFGNPTPGGSLTDRLRGVLQARRRARVVWALRTMVGMVALEQHQTRVVVAAAIVHRGRVLAARRTHPAAAAGRWEFPGGKGGGGGERQAGSGP